MKKTHHSKKFMSYNGRVIWYTVVDGVISHLEAMDYIDSI